MKCNQIIEQDLSTMKSASLDWSQFDGKTILVTGAAGFLPAYIVELLHSLGENNGPACKILALVRGREKAEKRFAHLLESRRFILINQDVCDPISVHEKIDFIIHAASQASPRFYSRDPIGTFNANVFGTKQLLQIGLKNKVKSFLFFSSGEVYGQVHPECIPIKENDYGWLDPTNIRSCYAEGKRAGETLCVCWHHQHGIPAKIVRPFHTYGPGMSLDDGRVFADFVADAVAGRDILLKSKGTAQRAFCYLADATIGFLTVLTKGAPAIPYNIGNPDAEVSMNQLAEIIAKVSKEVMPSSISVVQSRQGHDSSYLESPIIRNSPDISRISQLGWKPSTSLQEGFKKTIQSYL